MAVLSSIPGLSEALTAISQGSRDGATNADGTVRNTYPDLPMDREFRVQVVESKFATAQSGAPGIRYVLEVTEGEFKGSRIWDSIYFTGHPFQGQRLAVLLTSAGVEASTVEEAADKIVGGKLVVALKPGTDPRYPGTRWTNVDQGQKLRDNLKPPKGAESAAPGLSATGVDDLIQKRSEPITAPSVAPVVGASAQPITLPNSGGVKLPGMG